MTGTEVRLLTATWIAVVGLALSGCSFGGDPVEAPSSTAGPSRASDDMTAEDLSVGDCLNDADLSGIVTSVPVVPCSEPHDSEAYAEFELDEGPFPGSEEIDAKGNAGCVERFTEFVGIAFNESDLEYSFYLPTESSWPQGDRRILCEVYDPKKQTTGTLKGAAR
jgi:hypothetical protein